MQTEITGRKPARPLPLEERYGVTVQVAAEFIGISRSRIYELLSAGELEGKIIHGRRIVLVASLLRMLGGAPAAKREDVADRHLLDVTAQKVQELGRAVQAGQIDREEARKRLEAVAHTSGLVADAA